MQDMHNDEIKEKRSHLHPFKTKAARYASKFNARKTKLNMILKYESYIALKARWLIKWIFNFLKHISFWSEHDHFNMRWKYHCLGFSFDEGILMFLHQIKYSHEEMWFVWKYENIKSTWRIRNPQMLHLIFPR